VTASNDEAKISTKNARRVSLSICASASTCMGVWYRVSRKRVKGSHDDDEPDKYSKKKRKNTDINI